MKRNCSIKKNKEKANVNQAGPWDFYLLIILPGIMEKLKAIQRRRLFVLKIDMNITISFPQKKPENKSIHMTLK